METGAGAGAAMIATLTLGADNATVFTSPARSIDTSCAQRTGDAGAGRGAVDPDPPGECNGQDGSADAARAGAPG